MVFLLVINSYLAPFQRNCRFSAENSTPPLFHPNFVFFLVLERSIADVGEDPKLIIRVITFELTQPIQPRYIDVTDGRTDGRTT